MNNLIKVVILGIIEGITEFLPVSSTGHLIIANQWFSLEKDFNNVFNIVIQLGAILSVVIFFKDKINPFSKYKTTEQRNEIFNLWKKSIVGVIPAIILGALLGDSIELLLFNPITVALALIVGGVILIFIESKKEDSRENYLKYSIRDLSYKDTLLIELFQCSAMIPGTSRSAATIIGAIFIGASRNLAVEFSFFLAIPTMFAASAYSLLKSSKMLTIVQWQLLSVGFIVSFLIAFIVIAAFMNYIRKRDFKPPTI